MSNNNFRKKITICCVIFLWTVGAQAEKLPPDPNNAALLYYQAFLLRPEPDAAAKELVYGTRLEKIDKFLRGGKLDPDPEVEIPEIEKSIRELEEKIKNRGSDPNKEASDFEQYFDFNEQLDLQFLKESRERYEKMRDIDPDKKIRNYLRKCGKVVELVEAASKIPECDWGILYSQGFSYLLPQLTKIRDLVLILRADILRLVIDGNYRAALERCLMMRRFAHHVGDEGVMTYLVSLSVDASALKNIQHLLGTVSPDVQTLTWLKNQLSIETGASVSPAGALKMDFELALHTLRINDKILMHIRHELAKKTTDEGSKKEALSLSDEQLLNRARIPYAAYLDHATQVMDSNMLYSDKYAEIQRLSDTLEREFGSDPAANQIIEACGLLVGLYDLQVRHATHLNALKTAIEIYLVKAKTGQLPQTLPEGLPKDPYTDGDFGYEITDEGFALRCQGQDFQKGRMKQMLEFKLKK